MKPVVRHLLLGVTAVAALCAVAAAGYYRSARRLREAQDSTKEAPTAVTAQAHGLAATAVEQGRVDEEAEELLRLREKERAWTAELNRREEAVRARLKAVLLNPKTPGGGQATRPAPVSRVGISLAELKERDPRNYEIILRKSQQRKRNEAQVVERRREALAGLDPALLPEAQFKQLRDYLELVQRFDTEELEPEERKRLETEIQRTMFQMMPLARRYDYAAQGKDAEEMERREKAIAVLQATPAWFPQLPVLERREE